MCLAQKLLSKQSSGRYPSSSSCLRHITPDQRISGGAPALWSKQRTTHHNHDGSSCASLSLLLSSIAQAGQETVFYDVSRCLTISCHVKENPIADDRSLPLTNH